MLCSPRRFVNKQQMQWTHRGAHLVLQIRVNVANGELQDAFRRWYPNFATPPPAANTVPIAEAA